MIVFDRVTLAVARHGHRSSVYAPKREVLSAVSLIIPTDRRIALFGPPADRRIVVNLLTGLSSPSFGRVIKRAAVSFPVGFLGSFDSDLPVRHNVAHVARLYGVDAEMLVGFIEQAGRFGPAYHKPYGRMSPKMKARLGYLVAYSIPFDVYVVTDGALRAAANQRDVLHTLFQERCRTSGMIVSTRNPKVAQGFCDMALVIDNAGLLLYDSVEKALASAQHSRALARAATRRG